MMLSPPQLQALTDFNAQLSQLEITVASIKNRLYEHHDRGQLLAAVNRLPRYTKDQEGVAIELVKPEFIQGNQAVSIAISALSDWYGESGYSTKFVHRTPGAIIVSQNDGALCALIVESNRLKKELNALLPAIGETDIRFDVIHRYHPMLVVLQLIRRISQIVGPPGPEAVTFSWGSKPAIYKVSPKDIVERLQSMARRMAIVDESSAAQHALLERDIIAVQSLPPDAELRLRRDLPPRPLMNIRWPEVNGHKNKAVREGHTPLVVVGSTVPVSIGSLKTFCTEKRKERAKRVDPRSLNWAPVVDTLPVFKVELSTADRR